MVFDEATSLRLIQEMLELMHVVGASIEPVSVLSVDVLNQTLTVTVEASSGDPMMLRGQAAAIMGGLSGFDIKDSFPSVNFATFGVRLQDRQGADVFSVVSKPEDAQFADGNVVRWLSNSIFQDNTGSSRRAAADRQIGILETSLRDLLDECWTSAHGSTYPQVQFDAKALQALRKSARQEGRNDQDGRELLDFTLLPQLADFFCTDPIVLAHSYVSDPAATRGRLTQLNKIRRKVAHYRPVSNEDVTIACDIVVDILEQVAAKRPELVDDFLVDRWEQTVARIVADVAAGFAQSEPPPVGSMPEKDRRQVAAEMLANQAAATSLGVTELRRLVVPPTRRPHHERAVSAFTIHTDAARAMQNLAEAEDASIGEIEAGAEVHAAAMKRVSELSEEIAELRFMSAE